MNANDAKLRREEAISYAVEIADGFKETKGSAPIAAWLETLADEFDSARRQGRGMDPDLVRITVQTLIDLVRFPPNDRPEINRLDQVYGRLPFRTPLFRYRSVRGRPEDVDGTARTVFTVSAVASRFDLDAYENDELSPNGSRPWVWSAMRVVAKANSRLRFGPSSYSGVRDSYERGLKLGYLETDGSLLGSFDKEMAIKMAMSVDD